MKQMLTKALFTAYLFLMIGLVSGPAPAQTITVNTNSVVTSGLTTQRWGISAANWSDVSDYQSYLNELGFKTLRWGGGSVMDEYHWATNYDESTGAYMPTTIDQWLSDYSSLGATGSTMEVNYGSGTAAEAASLVSHCIASGYHFEYWEIGNECYGSWEYDTHTVPHDPYTYAQQFASYVSAMKAIDPTIKCGCPIMPDEDDFNQMPGGESAQNPVTGAWHTGWTPLVLTYMRQLGVTPDFVIFHPYVYSVAGRENDAQLLSGQDENSTTIAQHVSAIRTILNQYLGANGPGVGIYNTEYDTQSGTPGKQSVSLVSGLYMARSLGDYLQTEVIGSQWWNFNNSYVDLYTNGNLSSSLYGWRMYGDSAAIQRDTADRYPTFYVGKMLNKWLIGNAQIGSDQAVSAGSTQSLLVPYAIQHADGSLGVLVVNTSPSTSYSNVTVSLTGLTTGGTATIWSYGIPNDNAAESGSGNRDLTQTTEAVSGSSVTCSFAPYSVTLICLPLAGSSTPAAPANLSATPGNNQAALTWQTSYGALTYIVLRSTVSGSGYTTVVSGLVGSSYTDTGLTNGTTYYYVVKAANTSGTSGNSSQAAITARVAAPASLSAAAGNGVIGLSWPASFGAASYNILRSTVNGSGYATVASGVTGTSYVDTGLVNGTAYYYVVTAASATSTSVNSNQTSSVPFAQALPLQIDCGSPAAAASPFVADMDYSSSVGASTGHAIDLTAVTNPAPQAVYQTERHGGVTYTPGGFTPGNVYPVRLHFCESWWTGPGERQFNVTINGTQVLTDFDVYAAAGATFKANIQQFNITANSAGQIVITTSSVIDNPLINGIEVLAPPSAPLAPTGLTANPGSGQATLAWTASSGATSYNVLRSTTSGTGYSAIASGITSTNYTNTGLTAGTPYFYVVTATNSVGTSGYSSQASVTPAAQALPLQIDCGGSGAAPFIADQSYSGGTAVTNWTGSIDTSAVTNPAPQSVYQSERYGNVTYSINGLTAGSVYTVRLHLCENYWTAAGEREFNVSINGTQALTNFDIFATTGAEHKATVQQFTSSANSSGQIVITFTTVLDNALVDGIEVLSGSGPTIPAPPTGLTATAGNAWVALSWTASTGATSYSVLRSTTNGSGYASVATGITPTSYTDTAVTNGTTYYYVATATNSAGTSGNSTQVSATPVSPVPAAPTGLTATAGNAQVALTWTASSGATSYNVLRSTTNGSGYASVATGITSTGYTDTGLTNGTTYYYVVTATNSGGTSGNSAQANATPVNSGSPPAAPTGVWGVGDNTVVGLHWSASTGATSYNVLRSTTSGSGYATIATGVTAIAYNATGLTNLTTYYFVVQAVNASGTSPNSAQASSTPYAQILPLQIDCGSSTASGSFIADQEYTGGTTATNWTGAIDTSAVTNPAPQAVYQSERYGNMTYTIYGLLPTTGYTVRLHFCENYWTGTGERLFNVSLNGSQVLTNFDVFATAGAEHKANIQTFSATSDGSGLITIVFATVTDNALIDGIEVY